MGSFLASWKLIRRVREMTWPNYLSLSDFSNTDIFKRANNSDARKSDILFGPRPHHPLLYQEEKRF